jgi:hypothetical protein
MMMMINNKIVLKTGLSQRPVGMQENNKCILTGIPDFIANKMIMWTKKEKEN